MTKDFESFLNDKYAELVNYTEDNTNNEELWERNFNAWLCDLAPDTWIKYGNEYKKCVL